MGAVVAGGLADAGASAAFRALNRRLPRRGDQRRALAGIRRLVRQDLRSVVDGLDLDVPDVQALERRVVDPQLIIDLFYGFLQPDADLQSIVAGHVEASSISTDGQAVGRRLIRCLAQRLASLPLRPDGLTDVVYESLARYASVVSVARDIRTLARSLGAETPQVDPRHGQWQSYLFETLTQALAVPRWAATTTRSRDELHQDVLLWTPRPTKRQRHGTYEPLGAAGVLAPDHADQSAETLLSTYRRIWLLGDPGYGKTWMLDRWASAMAEDALDALIIKTPDDFDLPLIPLRLGMRDLAKGINGRMTEAGLRAAARLDAEEFGYVAAEQGRQSLPRPWTDVSDVFWNDYLPRAIGEGRVHLLLDGWDEIDTDREPTRRTLTNYLAATEAPIAVTCRVAGFANRDERRLAHGDLLFDPIELDQGHAAVAELRPLTPTQRDRLVRAWFAPEPVPSTLDGRLRDSQSPVAGLARIPLLAALLCATHAASDGGSGRLPTTRTQLYHQVTADLLGGVHRRRAGADSDSEQLERDRLAALALYLADTHQRWDAYSRSQLRDALQAAGSGNPDAAIRDLTRTNGLLTTTTRANNDIGYSWLHLTFAEFFAGRAIASISSTDRQEVLDRRPWLDINWREALAFAVGSSDDADAVLRSVLDGGDVPFQHRLFVAAHMLPELPLRSENIPSTAGVIIERLHELTRHAIYRMYAAEALSRVARAGAEQAISGCLDVLRNGSHHTRGIVESALADVATTSPSVVEASTRMLYSDDQDERSAAVTIMKKVALSNPEARSALLAELSTAVDNDTRVCIIQVLGESAAINANVRSELLALLDDIEVGWAAADALASSVEIDPTVQQALLDRLIPPRSSIEALDTMVLAERVEERLDDVLRSQDGDLEARYLAFRSALDELNGRLEDVGRRALPHAISSPDDRTSLYQRLHGLVGEGMSELSKVIEGPSSALKDAAAVDGQLRSRIIPLLSEERRYVRNAAVVALSESAAHDPRVRQAMIDRVTDESRFIRWLAIDALAESANDNHDARVAIRECLNSDDAMTLRAALWAYFAITDIDRIDRDALFRVVEDESRSEDIRRFAASQLRKVAVWDSETRDLLMRLLDHSSEDIREGAADGLEDVASHDEHVLHALLSRVDDAPLRPHIADAIAPTATVDERALDVLLGFLDDEATDSFARRALVPSTASVDTARAILDKAIGIYDRDPMRIESNHEWWRTIRAAAIAVMEAGELEGERYDFARSFSMRVVDESLRDR